jgi:hypothetical protein
VGADDPTQPEADTPQHRAVELLRPLHVHHVTGALDIDPLQIRDLLGQQLGDSVNLDVVTAADDEQSRRRKIP